MALPFGHRGWSLAESKANIFEEAYQNFLKDNYKPPVCENNILALNMDVTSVNNRCGSESVRMNPVTFGKIERKMSPKLDL